MFRPKWVKWIPKFTLALKDMSGAAYYASLGPAAFDLAAPFLPVAIKQALPVTLVIRPLQEAMAACRNTQDIAPARPIAMEVQPIARPRVRPIHLVERRAYLNRHRARRLDIMEQKNTQPIDIVRRIVGVDKLIKYRFI